MFDLALSDSSRVGSGAAGAQHGRDRRLAGAYREVSLFIIYSFLSKWLASNDVKLYPISREKVN